MSPCASVPRDLRSLRAHVDDLPFWYSIACIMKSSRLLPALLLLFVGSGCAALIYEVVWFQLLELVIGSSAVSMGVLLGTFMGGMCLGSLLLPRFMRPDAHPLRVYAWLELGIGVIGLLLLFGMPLVGGVYTAWAGTGVVGMLLRGVAAGDLPAAADAADGRDAAGDRALGRSHRRRASPGSASSTAATPPAPSSAACSPASTCCAYTTSRSRRTWRSRSTSPSPRRAWPSPRVAPVRDAAVAEAPATRASRRARSVERVRRDRAVGLTALAARGALDAHAVAAVRRDDLHLLADPRGVPGRPRHRQQRRLGAGARPGAAARRARPGVSWLLCAAMAWTACILNESLPYWPINPSHLDRTPGSSSSSI